MAGTATCWPLSQYVARSSGTEVYLKVLLAAAMDVMFSKNAEQHYETIQAQCSVLFDFYILQLKNKA